MKDSVILGSGNSRYLKSVADFKTLYPTYDDFAAALVAGTLPIDLNGINSAGFQQIGDALCKATLLTDATCTLLDLPDTATPDDAFNKLVLPDGKYAVKVLVLSPGGLPMNGVTINGITTYAGKTAVTNSSGMVLGYSDTQSVTLTAVNDRYDISGNKSVSATLEAGKLNQVTIQFSRVSITQKTFSASQTIRFSPDVDTFDCSAIGGGANGSSGYIGGSTAYGGSGGNAGAVANKANIVNDESPIDIIVGGIGGTSKVGSHITANGAGGASGGARGYATASNQSRGKKGGDTSGLLYPPTDVGGAGGGGAAFWRGQGIASRGNGGSPGGGKGNQYSGNVDVGIDGTLPGAGGGGGAAYREADDDDTEGTQRAGTGKAGLCGIMWRYKS